MIKIYLAAALFASTKVKVCYFEINFLVNLKLIEIDSTASVQNFILPNITYKFFCIHLIYKFFFITKEAEKIDEDSEQTTFLSEEDFNETVASNISFVEIPEDWGDGSYTINVYKDSLSRRELLQIIYDFYRTEYPELNYNYSGEGEYIKTPLINRDESISHHYYDGFQKEDETITISFSS